MNKRIKTLKIALEKIINKKENCLIIKKLSSIDSSKNHYIVDIESVERFIKRDNKRIEYDIDDCNRLGRWHYYRYDLIPIDNIKSESVWNSEKINHIMMALKDGIPLPPIRLTEDSPEQYRIEDGIHRYNASIKSNFTHIPAVIMTEGNCNNVLNEVNIYGVNKNYPIRKDLMNKAEDFPQKLIDRNMTTPIKRKIGPPNPFKI